MTIILERLDPTCKPLYDAGSFALPLAAPFYKATDSSASDATA